MASSRPLIRDVERVILQDVAVDARLDLLQLLGGQRLGMGKVEAQPVGRDQRAGLAGMLAQHGVQLGVQQVGGGVVAHDVAPALDIHRGDARRRPPVGVPFTTLPTCTITPAAGRRMSSMCTSQRGSLTETIMPVSETWPPDST